MKRFIALFLSLIMTLSLCAPAWGEDLVELPSQDDYVARIEGIHYLKVEYALTAAVSGDEVVLLQDAELETDATLKAGVTYNFPVGKTLTVGANVTVNAADTATVNCYGTIVVSDGATVDISNLKYGTTFGACGGKLTIEDGGLAVLPDEWDGVWTPDKDASLGAMLKNCEVGAMVRCGDTTWEQVEEGVWVDMSTLIDVAQVGNVKYKTLAAAVAAANDGDTIELLQSVEAPGVVIDSSKYPTKGLTIDLNGFTYDVVAPTVGSTGTETNAFQLLKGGKITFKDGTITSSVAKILIQNYSDLTLLDVTVDGTKLQAPKYALSNNNGDVLITGNTSITAAADGVAFDVFRRSGYDGPSVTVDTTGTITGKVEIATSGSYPPADTNTAELKIKKGNFVGEITKDAASGDKATVAISGGTFSVDPTAFLAEGYVATKSGNKYVVGVAPDVAEVGGVKYTDLQKAINAGGTVKLLDNITLTEGVTVAAGQTVILDLAGKTVSMEVDAASPSALITNNGTLTIKDSGKNGTLSYATTTVSTGYSTSTIINNGTLTVTSGIIENTTSSTEKGAVYAIDSYGTLTVNGGTMTSTKIAIRQPVFNYDNAVTINDGIISGGTAGLQVHVFNSTVAITTKITGGSFSGTYAFYTYFYNIVDGSNVDIDVTGGTFDGYVYLYNHNKGSDKKPMDVAITNGYFDGGVYVYTYDASGNTVGIPAISGGYFTVAPADDYVVDGKVVVSSTKDGYPYTIGVKKTDVEVVVAAPEVKIKNTDNMTTDEVAAANKIAAEGGVELCDDALTAQATTIANADTTKVTDKIEDKLEDVLNTGVAKDEIVIVVKPYYEVTVEDVDLSGTTPTIKLDITPKYRKVATTQEVLNRGEKLVTEEGPNQNAIAVDKRPADMKEVTGAVNITVKIPAALVTAASANGNKLYVTHEASTGTYVYEATVDAANGTATFTNTHGFSVFTFSATNNIEASIGSDNYTSLQDALDAVKDGETIVVHKSNVDGETVKGSKKYEFTVELADNVTNVTIENNGTETTLNSGSTKFEVPKGSSGGGNYKPSTDKVTSAETFDAGIAMYVGMSIAAAAGSAVVIGKKKD